MAGQRDRSIDLINYAKNLGISVNIGKNKARGNKGFFKTNNSFYRIDIAKGLSEEEAIRVLVHELAHYVHYKYDNSLKSLDFIFKDNYSEYEEDLLKLTVDAVPKNFAENIISKRTAIKKEISELSKNIKTKYPEIKLSDKNNIISKEISKYDFKYLLKYDRVKVFKGFFPKTYSIKTIKEDFPDIKQDYVDYIKLCSLKRNLSRMNSKISRLNRYYNTPSELLARSFEYYILNSETMKHKTPKLYEYYKETIPNIEILKDLTTI